MQQRKLSFQRISADDAQQQRALVALQWEKDHPAAAAVPAEPKRGPGRPPKKRELALEQAAAEQKPSQKPRTGEYTTWFSSPYLLDVLKMLRAHQFSAKRTVAALKRTAPDDRYARLSDSTIRGWFEKGTKQLLPQFQQQLDGVAVMRSGRPSQMSTAVEEECKRVLLKLRDALCWSRCNFRSNGSAAGCAPSCNGVGALAPPQLRSCRWTGRSKVY